MTFSINTTTYPSPNYDEREQPPIRAIVVHSTEGYWDGDARWMQKPASENPNPVSCHFVIDPFGGIFQMVPVPKRAWHAGEGTYLGLSDWNDFSIGIELSHYSGDPYGTQQLPALTWLCHQLIPAHAIPRKYVVTHRQIAPDRKIDPTNWPQDSFDRWADSLYAPVDPLKAATLPGPGGVKYTCGTGCYNYYYTPGYNGMWNLGYALGPEVSKTDSLGKACTIMPFERGVLKYLEGVGVQPALLAEIISQGWAV